MAATSSPVPARARAAWSPVRTLTSCSGDGPPKMTAGWLMLRSPRVRGVVWVGLVGSGEVVGQVVLVEHDITRLEMLLYPLDRLFPRLHQHDLTPGRRRLGRAALE